ncbi:MAG: endonuclease [Bacteroidetes bacterium HGW-Bacteroidetes-10]|nr:MAG: endonuclease [Bacteroidetes bacterium HGW-Bacteroidetes-10]
MKRWVGAELMPGRLYFIGMLAVIPFFFCYPGRGLSQSRGINTKPVVKREDCRILFWNLENYFDTRDDLSTADDDFTPMGEMHWSRKKFNAKRNAIAKYILLLSGDNMPVIASFAEVENKYVINQLLMETPLSAYGYGVIHRDSPDRRGIDVALIYIRERYTPVSTQFIRIAADSLLRTRLILYSKGVLDGLDTLHLFINHWPSKFGGERATEGARRAAAEALGRVTDSIFFKNRSANIVVTGDFNEEPEASAAATIPYLKNLSLFASMKYFSDEESSLTTKPVRKNKIQGSIKFMGVWELIDHFLVSPNLLNVNEPIFCGEGAMEILAHPYLMEEDRKFTGRKPRRTFVGPRYNWGVSDHLPIMLTIKRSW